MWNEINELKSLSAWFQWLSIGLVFISGFLQIGKYVVDRREKFLSEIEQANRLNPARQPIHTGTATIEMVVEFDKTFNNHFMDRGAYVAFGLGSDAILIMRSIDCFAVPGGENETLWRAVVTLDASNSSNGKQINFLKEAEYIQIGFGPLAAKSRVKRGTVIVTLNSAVRLEVVIPPQEMNEDKILIHDLSELKAKL